MSLDQVRHISRCTIIPQRTTESPQTPERCQLTSWDLSMLSIQYIQKGLLFYAPSSLKHPSNPVLHLLKKWALCAHVWRSVTRARKLSPDETTTCKLIMGNRTRLQPPLSPFYFGNCVQYVGASSTAMQLLSHDLGWATWLLHQSVATQTDATVRGTLDAWVKVPFMLQESKDKWGVTFTSSPRFNMYGNVFGWGRPVAVHCGGANKFDGKVTSYPGSGGGGSVDLEICLFPEFMNALELDDEFMDAVSHS